MPYKPISSSITGRQNVTAFDMVKDAGPDIGITTQSTQQGKVVRTFDRSKKVAGWRVAGFHVLNLLTGGFAGGIGALCAKSQAMGSQKNVHSTRHFGQLSNASMRINKRDGFGSTSLKVLANIWSFPAHLILSPVRLLQNSLGPDMSRFRNLRSKEFGKSKFTMFSSVKGISTSAAKNRKDVFGMMHREITTAEQASAKARKEMTNYTSRGQKPPEDYRSGPVRVACSSGSPSLQKAMLQHAKSEFNDQNVAFLKWSSKVLDRADPQSPNFDRNYRISKREMLDAYENFVKTGSDYEINIDSRPRQWAQQHLDPARSGSLLHDYKQRLNAENHGSGGNNRTSSRTMGVHSDPNELEEFPDIEQETFGWDEHLQVVEQLKLWDHKICDIQQDSVGRLRNRLQREAGIADD